jgi:PIN domain
MAAKKASAKTPLLDAIVFIDTNIFLDFYRVRGWESGLSVLRHISENHARIVTGSQIDMEFKKNRQKVILDSLGKAKTPDLGALTVPTFLHESKPNRALKTAKKQIESQLRKVRARIEKVLRDPGKNDPVYKVAQALFKNDCAYNLSREKDARFRIRRLALKRFMLGYPPRKDADTSIGDAINWEWIVRCAIDSGKHVILVSRDSDYGHAYEKAPVLNDWLRQEFAERVGRTRKIVLTDRLTDAFKRIAVPVTREEEEQENSLVKHDHLIDVNPKVAAVLAKLLSGDEYRAVELVFGIGGTVRVQPDDLPKALGIPEEAVRSLLEAASEKVDGKLIELSKSAS